MKIIIFWYPEGPADFLISQQLSILCMIFLFSISSILFIWNKCLASEVTHKDMGKINIYQTTPDTTQYEPHA